MGRPELATLGSLVRTYFAPALYVPSVRSLGDRSTWLTLGRMSGNDMDWEFTHPQNRQSERRVVHYFGSPFS